MGRNEEMNEWHIVGPCTIASEDGIVATVETPDKAKRIVDKHNESMRYNLFRSPILGETWEVGGRVGPGTKNGYTAILREGETIATCIDNDYSDAMAALPDALRALVLVQNSYNSHEASSITCVIKNDHWQKLIDALKKSGIRYIC